MEGDSFISYHIIPYHIIPHKLIDEVQLGIIVFVTLLNFRGMQVVGAMSIVLFLAIIFPFVMEASIVIFNGDLRLSVWTDFPDHKQINMSDCLAFLLWCFTGWDFLGTFAGEGEGIDIHPGANSLSSKGCQANVSTGSCDSSSGVFFELYDSYNYRSFCGSRVESIE
jgi:hypothetical protein